MDNTGENSEILYHSEVEDDLELSPNENTGESNITREVPVPPPIVFSTSTGPISFSVAQPRDIRRLTRLPTRSGVSLPQRQSRHVGMENITNSINYISEPMSIQINTLSGEGSSTSTYSPTSFQFYNLGSFPIGGSAAAAHGNVVNESLYDKEAYKHVLSEEGNKMIKYRKHNNDDEIKQCPIMFTDFEEGEEIAELPCKHIFGKDAIVKWLEKEDASCPVCRDKLDSKEVKNEDEESISPRLPTFSQLLDTFRQRQRDRITFIDEVEDRALQMAIEQSLRE